MKVRGVRGSSNPDEGVGDRVLESQGQRPGSWGGVKVRGVRESGSEA